MCNSFNIIMHFILSLVYIQIILKVHIEKYDIIKELITQMLIIHHDCEYCKNIKIKSKSFRYLHLKMSTSHLLRRTYKLSIKKHYC